MKPVSWPPPAHAVKLMKFSNPYARVPNDWLKGSLHCHSTRSDGAQEPQTVIDSYRSHGYDFCALTDHNKHADGQITADGLISLTGCEYNDFDYVIPNRAPHIGVVGTTVHIPHLPDVETAHAAVLATGGFSTYNHPIWHYAPWPQDLLLRLRGFHALEINNALVNTQRGPADAQYLWDRLLTAGYRIWGTAADDAHQAHERNLAWVMVNAERQTDSIVSALKSGRFYATTGVQLHTIQLDADGVLTVAGADVEEIRIYVRHGELRQHTKNSSTRYQLREDDVYVRVVAYSAGTAAAWTNPIFVESDASRRVTSTFATSLHTA
ncbi:MAG: CehA/McbA family metallohydrolase [Planctomycetota bacterium]